MKRLFAITILTAALAFSSFAATKTYQVTGPVLEVSPDMIVVKKGNDRWEIARDGSTKITGDLKVGAKVTIEYRMMAASVSVKAESAAPAKKKK